MTTPARGVRLAGSGAAAPAGTLSNADLQRMGMDTTDEWIQQRTGIKRRHVCDHDVDTQASLAISAMRQALGRASMDAGELDLLINATVTPEMSCPSNACRIAAALGATPAPAFDLTAACSGFMYGLNVADSLIRSGRHRKVGVIGCDVLSRVVDYDDRTVSILFGDGAGAVVLSADDDPGRGCLHQAMGADGSGWHSLYMPVRAQDVPASDADNPIRLGCLRMNGREVYRFAVKKFEQVIREALEATNLQVDDVAQFVCHQSNVRIIEAAKERIGLPDDKVHVNIDEYGNTSSGSIGLVYEDLVRAERVKEGDIVVFVAFGGGLTWASSVWRL